MKLSLASVVVASRHQLSSRLGEEVVILGLQDGTYYGLDGIGPRVWELMQEPRPVQGILDRLLEEYEVDASRCEEDLLALLERLRRPGLIEVAGGPPLVP